MSKAKSPSRWKGFFAYGLVTATTTQALYKLLQAFRA